MRRREWQNSLFESLCVGLILAPCAALAQQAATAPQQAAASTNDAARSPSPSASAAPASSAPQKDADDLEPAVDTSRGASQSSDERAQKPNARGSGKAMDHLELGTTDITGNRELPKVMYIVPWKRSDLGDLTGKPLNSLVDQTLEPVDRNVFERANRYYGAVTGGAAQDVHRTPDAGTAPAVRDER